MWIHGVPVVAVHAHPVVVRTVKLPVPPPDGIVPLLVGFKA
jgi:hypothetical protein